MTERKIELRTADGVVDGYFFPAQGGSGPGVIHLTDIRGNRPANREKSAWLAAQGYSVLQPNVFYRTGKEPVFDFKFVFGEERSMQRFRELTQALNPAAQERDAAAYVAELRKLPEVSPGPLGVVGHCFTGPMALRVAAVCPDQIRAAASFHGGGIATAAADSPHLSLPRVRAELYFAHASNDALMPAEAIQTLEKALAEWAQRGGKYESETFDHVRHGWTMSDGPVYDAEATERAHAKLLALFARALR